MTMQAPAVPGLGDRRLLRYAAVLLWGLATARRQGFRPEDVVLIRFDPPAVRLAEILHRRILQEGMHPVFRMNPTAAMEQSFFGLANDRQLAFTAPGEAALMRRINGIISLYAPESLTHLSGVDPKKIGKAAASNKFLRDILTKRESAGLSSWTIGLFPTEELARRAGLSLEAYTRQVIRACFLNRVDPVAQWQEVFDRAKSIKQRLNRLHAVRYHVESESIDLHIGAGEKRKWIGVSGRNIPSFELFTSPDWRQTEGVYYADQASFRSGHLVKGVRLEFRRGRAVAVSARQGESFVSSQLALDHGADKLGEFSLTDRRFSRIDCFMANTLYDENYGGRYGNCHVALGSSYANAYRGRPADLTSRLKKKLGFNDSALHWDLVNTEKKRVRAIGPGGRAKTIYENGEFLF